MVRIEGRDLPQKKRVCIAVQTIMGIGQVRAKQICSDLHIQDSMRVHEMDPELVARIVEYITSKTDAGEWFIEGSLRRKVSSDIIRLQHINCYRGLRHRNKLPAHGQRTKSNARVAKGKAGATAITRKKK